MSLAAESHLEKMFGLRPGERGAALLLVITGAALIAGSTIAKSLRDSLFLDAFPAQTLPLVLIATAVLTAPLVSLYSHLASRVSFRFLVPGFYMLVALGFILIERLSVSGYQWAPIALYLYVNLLGLFAVSQFWLLVGWRFGTRDTRRLIGLLGAGNVIGGLLGGLLARVLTTWIPPEAILWLVSGLFATAGLAAERVLREHPDGLDASALPTLEEATGIRSALREIAATPLLRGIVGLLTLSVLVGALTEYQFKFTAQATYSHKVELVRFFSGFYAIIGVAQILLQLGATRYVLRRWGVAGSLMLLPLALAPGAAAMLLVPGILAATLLRAGDQVVRNSAYRSGFEILYLPLPTEMRRQVKPVIDVFLERCADGLSGLILLLLTSLLHLGIWGLNVVSLLVILVLAAVIIRLRQAYILTLEKNLAFASSLDFPAPAGIDGVSIQAAELPGLSVEEAPLLRFSATPTRPLQIEPGSVPDWPRELPKPRPSVFPAAAPAILNAPDWTAAEIFERLVGGRELREALASARKLADPRLAAAILALMDDPPWRKEAEATLQPYGASIAGLLSDTLFNEQAGNRLRRHAARLLGEMDSPLAEWSLKRALQTRPGEVRRAASTALYIMRSRGYGQPLPVDDLYALLEPEVRRYLSVWEADAELRKTGSSDQQLDAIASSVRETKSRTVRHLFRLLGLGLPPDAIQAAYKGMAAGSPQVRDQAFEYLDNVLPERLRHLIWPLLDPEERTNSPPKKKPLDHIVQDLKRSGVTINLPRELIDLGQEPNLDAPEESA